MIQGLQDGTNQQSPGMHMVQADAASWLR